MIDPTRGFSLWIVAQRGKPTSAGEYERLTRHDQPVPPSIVHAAWREWLDHCSLPTSRPLHISQVIADLYPAEEALAR